MSINMHHLSVDVVEIMLEYIDPSINHDKWFAVLAGLKNEFGEDVRDIAESWSRQGSSFSQVGFNSTWRACKQGQGYGVGTVIKFAKDAGFEFTNDIKKLSCFEIKKRKSEKDIRQVEAEKSKQKQKYYAGLRLKKLLPKIIPDGEPKSQYLFNRLNKRFKTPDSIQFNPLMDYWEGGKFIGNFPSIVSFVTDINNNLITFHVIYLTNEGHKASVNNPKKILTPITTITGTSIKFAWPNDILYLAEGIETSLAIWLITGEPTWCCLSSHGLETVIIPPKVKEVYIMGDKDRSGAGQKSADKLAQRLIKNGFIVHILIPKQEIPVGSKSIDWLDVYRWESVE